MTNQLGLAREACNHSLQLRPNDAATLDSRGFVNLKAGDWFSAIDDYDSALKIRPNLDTSLYGRGVSKLKMGDTAGGDADIEAAKVIRSSIAEDFKASGVH